MGDSLSNIYNYQVVNKSRQPINVEYKLEGIEGRTKNIGGDIVVKKGEVAKGSFLVIIPKSALHQSKTPVIIGIYHNGKHVEDYKTMFAAPNSLDK
jgi:malate/lactate dehydrogenase